MIPGGETYDEVERRMLKALPMPDEVPDGAAVAVFGHGGSIRAAVAGLFGEAVASDPAHLGPPEDQHNPGFLNNAAYLTLVAGPDGEWTLEGRDVRWAARP
jgi:broad specificity phosphatase PhoE